MFFWVQINLNNVDINPGKGTLGRFLSVHEKKKNNEITKKDA